MLLTGDIAESDWLGALVAKITPLDGEAALPITISSALPITSGYHRSTVNTASFIGTADPAAGSIVVAGAPAAWDAVAGTWSIANVSLNPGINRIIAKAFAGPAGSGNMLNEAFIDIWYDAAGVSVSVPMGSVWKYHDQGQNLGTAWKEENYPAADAWPQGAGELGYGESDQSPTGTISYGSDPDNKFITSYFRHQFTIAAGDAALFTQASVTIKYDDGAVIYINGTEIGRPDMPAAPTDISFTTRATATRDNLTTTIPFSPTLLHDGLNTIAVEVHQVGPGSSDLTFNLSLSASQPTFGTSVSGTLPAGTTTWTAEQGPYTVTANVTIPVGATLVIQPGTTVFFNSGTRLNINGRLLAQGTQWERIRFTRVPGGARWGGFRFTDTQQDNQMSYFDQEYGDSQNYGIGVTRSKLTIDQANWAFANRTVIEVLNPSLLVKNSHFPAIGGGEVIHGEHIVDGEYLIVDGNVFDKGTNSDDIIDFLGADRPGPVFQVLNNIFLGGSDDGIDLDGTDAHVEGNIFTGFHLNTTRPTTSNAIATGEPQSGEANRTQITVVRNLFFDNDHAILLKEEAFATVVNNVFASSTLAGIQFNEIGGTAVAGPGRGAYLDGNIFYDTPLLFKNVQPTTELVVNRSIVTAAEAGLGSGNLTTDPLFVDADNRDYRLLPSSPAIGSGPNGRDMGTYVSPGASIDGEPTSPTTATAATLIVGGPDIYAYKYRVNGGPWSGEIATQNLESLNVSVPPIQLSDLTPGQYSVEVLAKNSAGVWQAEASATQSQNWTVQLVPTAAVVGSHAFYNNSLHDNADAAANANDDAAIAIDKLALRPGQTASLANYTSYSRGINGVMVDLANRPLEALLPSDFQFRVGNDHAPGGWSIADAPESISVRTGAGMAGSDRVTIIWPDGAIQNEWLEVTVSVTPATGLTQPYVFYFGNAVAESGDSSTNAIVNATDELGARNNAKTFLDPAGRDNAFDYNRDGLVNATDQIIARSNSTSLATALKLISVPGSVQLGAASSSLLDNRVAIGLASPRSRGGELSRTSLVEIAFSGPLPSPAHLNSDVVDDAEAASSAATCDFALLVQPASLDEELYDLIAANLIDSQL